MLEVIQDRNIKFEEDNIDLKIFLVSHGNLSQESFSKEIKRDEQRDRSRQVHRCDLISRVQGQTRCSRGAFYLGRTWTFLKRNARPKVYATKVLRKVYRQQKLGAFKSVRKKNLYLDSTPEKEYSLSRDIALAAMRTRRILHARVITQKPREAVTSRLFITSQRYDTNEYPSRGWEDEGCEQWKNLNSSGETVKFATVIVKVLFSTVHETQSSLTSTGR